MNLFCVPRRSLLLASGATALVGMPQLVSGAERGLPRATPESQSIDSRRIHQFISAADKEVNSMHSFMLLRRGYVVAESWWSPEAADKPHVLWSLSKSFTSTAVGLAAADGKLSIDDLLVDHFPDDLPPSPSENLKKMRIRDLLTMATGHQDEPRVRENDRWKRTFLAHPVPHKPGTHFKYNTAATYMLSAIVQQATGEKVVDYLGPRLFAPLGVTTPTWDESPEGISLGGYGLYLKTEDIAKFGQLLLRAGRWNGQQLVPNSWVQQATARQVSNGSSPDSDWDQGYGFQFWRCRHNAFRGDGKDGQFCVVLPEQDAVIAITANTRNLQGVLNLVWQHLLPAMTDRALPQNPAANEQLSQIASGLEANR